MNIIAQPSVRNNKGLSRFVGLHPFIPSLFFAFRLVYIPAAILFHTGHGLPYLNTALVLCATFGLETLTRRSRQSGAPAVRAREVWFVVVALLLLGLFPEEAPTSIILWAAIGAVWGRLWPSRMRIADRRGLLSGGLLGLTGLVGPGSWLLAGMLALWAWRGTIDD